MKEKNYYSFSSICSRLENKKYDKNKAPEDMKLLIDVANCFFAGTAATTAVAAGAPEVAAAITLGGVIKQVAEKGKVLDAAKRIMELFCKEKTSFKEKYERMQEAYTILWVASFFDALAATVPQSILDEIALTADNKKIIAAPNCLPDRLESDNYESEIELPNLVFGVSRVYNHLVIVYKIMTERLGKFIGDLAFSDEADEVKQRTLNARLDELPNAALEVFKSEYLTLCSKFPEFAAYINLEKEREYTIKVDEQYQALVDLIINSKKEELQEFQTLEKAVVSLHEVQRKHEAKMMTDHIIEHYKKLIARPIFEIDDSDDDELRYPPINKAFVPQRYKLLEYTSKDMRLELESQWKDYEPQTDMLAFWGRYLLDPQSSSHLLLILGEPGGGKSLLTEIVSAYIGSNAELVVRIPMRRYSTSISEADVEDMICQQIKDDGDGYRKPDSFKQIVGDAPERPTTIIFDGYDEVQQATGLAFPGFLKKLRKFQNDCSEENRPVRIVVTSRRTLIDKAIIPIGTVVMKLLPFTADQKTRWIETWNLYNHELLSNAGLADFCLPQNNQVIDELSSQPLLLLMLAIYDADFEMKQNALQITAQGQSEDFNRMRLYDTLIRRFVRRELRKDESQRDGTHFSDETWEKQKKIVNSEVEKLGIAALGMFVRRRLWITVPELNADFLKLKAKTRSFDNEESLEAGEVFFGSFFFIHDSRSKERIENETAGRYKKHEKDASFVFLHKTFYEFLVADYVLNCILQHAIDLISTKSTIYYERSLLDFDLEHSQFYISLNDAPLCAEPEITIMISEWGLQKADVLLKEQKVSKEQNEVLEEELLDVLGDMIEKHAECIRKGTLNPSNELSLLKNQTIPQRNALYILNLVTIMVQLTGKWKTELDTWKFLAQYVKLYGNAFGDKTEVNSLRTMGLDASEELPFRFMTLFQMKRSSEGYVEIIKRNKMMELADQSPLEARTEVFHFLQDNISEKIYSIHSVSKQLSEKQKQIKELAKFDTRLSLEVSTVNLQLALLRGDMIDSTELTTLLWQFSKLIRDEVCAETVFTWLTCYQHLAKNSSFNIAWEGHNKSIVRITVNIMDLYLTHGGEWEGIIFLWLDMFQNNPVTLKVILTELLDCEIGQRYNSISDDFIYKISTIIPENIDTDLIRQLYYGNGKRSHRFADFIFRLKDSRFTGNAKTDASILMLNRKIFQSNNYQSFDIIDRLTELSTQEHINMCKQYQWIELPYLLREYILIGISNTVKDILNDIDLNLIKLCSPVICEYIALADEVAAVAFLYHAFELTSKILKDHPNCSFAFIRIVCALVQHSALSEDLLSQTIKMISDVDRWKPGLVFQNDPVGITRLLTLLMQNLVSHSFTWFLIDYLQTAINNIDTTFRTSPETAIAFIDQLSTISNTSIVDRKMFLSIKTLIKRLINRASLNDQKEIAAQLKDLAETPYFR